MAIPLKQGRILFKVGGGVVKTKILLEYIYIPLWAGLGVYGKKIKSKKYIASESSSDESKVDVTHADVYTETVLEDHDHPFVAIKEEVLAEYSDEAENLDGLVVNDIKLEKPDSDPEEDEEYPLEYSAIDIVDNLSPLRQSQLENQIEDSTTPQE